MNNENIARFTFAVGIVGQIIWFLFAFQMIIGETPGNPLLNILDLESFGALGQKHNVLTIVDCTYATPCTIQPIKYGIDIVWHSG